MEETLRSQLLLLASLFEQSCGMTPQTVGKRALNDNKTLLRIRDGGGFNVSTFDRLVVWFSENWPPDIAWPSEIERPEAALVST